MSNQENDQGGMSAGAVDVLARYGNPREQLEAVQDWLSWQDEDLSAGLRTAEDALNLYRYWLARPELPEMADDDGADDEIDMAAHRVAALGYDPMTQEARRHG